MVRAVFSEKVDRESLIHEEGRVVVIDADLHTFKETLRSVLQWHSRVHLCQHLLTPLIDNDHGEVTILYEIASFVVKGFQSDASVATLFAFFLNCQLAIDAFRDFVRDGCRRTVLSILEDGPCKTEKADKKLLVVEVVALRQLLALFRFELAVDFNFDDLLDVVQFEFEIELLELLLLESAIVCVATTDSF